MSETSSAADDDWFPEVRDALRDAPEGMLAAATKQYCPEVVAFYFKAYFEYASSFDASKREQVGEEIESRFLDPDSAEGINVTGMERQEMKANQDGDEKWPMDLYDCLKYNILLLLHSTVLPTFKNSPEGLVFTLNRTQKAFRTMFMASTSSAALTRMGTSLQVRQRHQDSLLAVIGYLKDECGLDSLIGTHKFRLRKFDDCLVAKDLAAILVKSEICQTVADAVELCLEMAACAVIYLTDDDSDSKFAEDGELWSLRNFVDSRSASESQQRSVAMIHVNFEVLVEGQLLMKKKRMSRFDQVYGLITEDNNLYLYRSDRSSTPFAVIDVPSCSSNVNEWHGDDDSHGFKLNSSATNSDYIFLLPDKVSQIRWMDALYSSGAKFMHGSILDQSHSVLESLDHVDERDVRGLVTTRMCPFSRRVLVFRQELDMVPLTLVMPKEVAPDGDLKAFAPSGKVPILWFKSGAIIEESLTIMRWFGGQSDLWCAASSRARMDQLYSIADHSLWPHVPIFCMSSDKAKKEAARAAIIHAANSAQPYLDRGESLPWALEGRFTVADLSLPLLIRRAVERGFSLDGMTPRVRRWVQAVFDRPSVQQLFN